MSNRSACKRRFTRVVAGLAVIVVAALVLTGCSFGYPHACDGHGGTRVVLKGIYYCHDGSSIGGGWLWLHPHDPRARP
jgi:hypothetical protein